MKELLLKIGACELAKKWADGKSWKEIHETCHRGDWLLWLWFETMNHDNEEHFRLLTVTKGHCANTVRHLMKDARSIAAVDAAMNYSGDRIALTNAAAYAATAAAYAAAATAAADAYAAYAATAAYAAAYAAAAKAAAAAARISNQLQTADICRKFLPIEVWNIQIDLQW